MRGVDFIVHRTDPIPIQVNHFTLSYLCAIE